ncbi:hypothetical protein [Streptomyces sp. NPDC049555]|uniref:hypothetical protein n=1 Tax=Streptomyces sp. NPDC049555 TaxID=3154930 RepID=UPI003448FB40
MALAVTGTICALILGVSGATPASAGALNDVTDGASCGVEETAESAVAPVADAVELGEVFALMEPALC